METSSVDGVMQYVEDQLESGQLVAYRIERVGQEKILGIASRPTASMLFGIIGGDSEDDMCALDEETQLAVCEDAMRSGGTSPWRIVEPNPGSLLVFGIDYALLGGLDEPSDRLFGDMVGDDIDD